MERLSDWRHNRKNETTWNQRAIGPTPGTSHAVARRRLQLQSNRIFAGLFQEFRKPMEARSRTSRAPAPACPSCCIRAAWATVQAARCAASAPTTRIGPRGIRAWLRRRLLDTGADRAPDLSVVRCSLPPQFGVASDATPGLELPEACAPRGATRRSGHRAVASARLSAAKKTRIEWGPSWFLPMKAASVWCHRSNALGRGVDTRRVCVSRSSANDSVPSAQWWFRLSGEDWICMLMCIQNRSMPGGCAFHARRAAT